MKTQSPRCTLYLCVCWFVRNTSKKRNCVADERYREMVSSSVNVPESYMLQHECLSVPIIYLHKSSNYIFCFHFAEKSLFKKIYIQLTVYEIILVNRMLRYTYLSKLVWVYWIRNVIYMAMRCVSSVCVRTWIYNLH